MVVVAIFLTIVVGALVWTIWYGVKCAIEDADKHASQQD